jgi:hypothetical protein
VAERRFGRGADAVERALETLRAMPPVDPASIDRVVATAARVRVQDGEPNDDDLFPAPVEPEPRGRVAAFAAAAAILLAVGAGAGIWQLSRPIGGPAAAAPFAAQTAAPPVIPVARPELESLAIPTQFVYDGAARRVALVGDFNGWDESATPLEREPGSSLWSVTVPLQRGRHVYAFIVDSAWMTDRHAPASRDPDFGVEGSTIIVGQP